jgi:hypothetical protein
LVRNFCGHLRIGRRLSWAALKELQGYDRPGNVRELGVSLATSPQTAPDPLVAGNPDGGSGVRIPREPTVEVA